MRELGSETINPLKRNFSGIKHKDRETKWGWAVPSSGEARASQQIDVIFHFHFSKIRVVFCLPEN